jgi:hypothetical protein
MTKLSPRSLVGTIKNAKHNLISLGVWSWVVFGHNAGYPKSWVKNKMILMASVK